MDGWNNSSALVVAPLTVELDFDLERYPQNLYFELVLAVEGCLEVQFEIAFEVGSCCLYLEAAAAAG